ncbi:ABC transporter permease [Agromyces sp. MMS24-K17]|uniref:ABC transporter permease n=1 Tax=Agromyces sp. MMS24-K17 TaxID=3372850 RepID=UPI0037544F26
MTAVTAGIDRARAGALVPATRIGTVTAVAVLGVFLVAAVAPGVFTPVDPARTDLAAVLRPPSATHVLGTDELGRDLLARLVHGTGPSLAIGVGATIVGLLLGLVVAGAALLGPRWLDDLLMRVTDVGLAFPEILLALLVIAVLGPGPVNAAVAIGVGSAPGFARLLRARARVVQTSLFVEAATGFGVRPVVATLRHVVPNAVGPVVVLATISAGTNIIIAAGLSFLGFGAAPPAAEWGLTLAQGRNVIGAAWWVALFPGLAITVVVLAVTAVGRALERRLGGEVER